MGVNEISDGCRHRIVADDIEIVETAVAVAEGAFMLFLSLTALVPG